MSDFRAKRGKKIKMKKNEKVIKRKGNKKRRGKTEASRERNNEKV